MSKKEFIVTAMLCLVWGISMFFIYPTHSENEVKMDELKNVQKEHFIETNILEEEKEDIIADGLNCDHTPKNAKNGFSYSTNISYTNPVANVESFSSGVNIGVPCGVITECPAFYCGGSDEIIESEGGFITAYPAFSYNGSSVYYYVDEYGNVLNYCPITIDGLNCVPPTSVSDN